MKNPDLNELSTEKLARLLAGFCEQYDDVDVVYTGNDENLRFCVRDGVDDKVGHYYRLSDERHNGLVSHDWSLYYCGRDGEKLVGVYQLGDHSIASALRTAEYRARMVADAKVKAQLENVNAEDKLIVEDFPEVVNTMSYPK